MRFALVLALAATACGGGGSDGSGGGPTGPGTPSTPANPVATTSVALQNSSFSPANIVVSPGATITFDNTDNIDHNVSFGQGITSIGAWRSGTRTAVMPTATGTYQYTCTLHAGMSGSVKVQ